MTTGGRSRPAFTASKTVCGTPNSLNLIGPTTKMMPEGSRKVCVLNGSRPRPVVASG